KRIEVTGNPINEVITYYNDRISSAEPLTGFALRKDDFFLVTCHRAENVNSNVRLKNILDALQKIQEKYNKKILVSTHPHTRDRMAKHGLNLKNSDIIFSEPLGFFDFIKLQQSAYCVLTDSGTVQEESCILGIP